MEILDEFTLTLKYQIQADTETGEVKTVCVSRDIEKGAGKPKQATTTRSRSTKKKEESSEPLLTLEDNKYILTQAACDLLGVIAGDKIDIKYDKKNKKDFIPVIGSDESWGTKQGNKLTKSNTVVCKGSKNDELSKYGNEFKLEPADKPGIFYLISKAGVTSGLINQVLDTVTEDLEEGTELALPSDVDLNDLLMDSEDAEKKEIEPDFFNFND